MTWAAISLGNDFDKQPYHEGLSVLFGSAALCLTVEAALLLVRDLNLLNETISSVHGGVHA
jgi:hypothetical protein